MAPTDGSGGTDDGMTDTGGPTAGSPTETGTPTASPSPTSQPLFGGHPAAASLASQPRLGPRPADAPATIVAFEDPSCTRCAAFERDVRPKIDANLVDTGKAAFVFRGYPVVYPWGEPATHVLEATYARSVPAFWALSEHYFERQRDFDSDSVYPMSKSFLAGEDVDAGAVIQAAKSGEADAAVQTDLNAGQNAGAGRTTPTLFLYRDGEYRTKTAGSVSYSVIANALGF